MAAERGVRVFTVGIGTESGEMIGAEGWSMRVRLDEESLKQIANITQGEYFYAGTANDLKKVYETLNIQARVRAEADGDHRAVRGGRGAVRVHGRRAVDAVVQPDPVAAGLAPDPALVDKLVVANRILYDQGVVDGFGHVSVRHDQRPGHFLLSRNKAPALVTREDIMEFDLDGEAVDGDGRPPYLERFIHSEIYRARARRRGGRAQPFAQRDPVRRRPASALLPIFHMSGFLAERLADLRDSRRRRRYRHADPQRALGAALAAHARLARGSC